MRPWILLNSRRRPWILLNSSWRPWIILNSRRRPWILLNSRRRPWILLNSRRRPWILLNSKRRPWILLNSRRRPWILLNYRRRPWILLNSKWSLLNPEPTISIPEVIVPSCQKHGQPDTEGKDRLLHVLLPWHPGLALLHLLLNQKYNLNHKFSWESTKSENNINRHFRA